eukprot:TRINITY_DN32512_c0_g1_i1.p1 TRINITY_DN32512_c0_g1~~TRINITY_DN32512_c0_g1_i1.p1  ORF type:complete len:115 (+),score=9.06 TRINITY_DN32512_c0_g1_i1:67-411(+)
MHHSYTYQQVKGMADHDFEASIRRDTVKRITQDANVSETVRTLGVALLNSDGIKSPDGSTALELATAIVLASVSSVGDARLEPPLPAFKRQFVPIPIPHKPPGGAPRGGRPNRQ